MDESFPKRNLQSQKTCLTLLQNLITLGITVISWEEKSKRTNSSGAKGNSEDCWKIL